MEKDEVHKKLSALEIGALVNLKWDRGVGPREEVVRFEGFKNNYPLLRFKGNNGYSDGNLLDIEAIGGYDSIDSTTPYNGKIIKKY